MVKRITKSRL